MGFIYRLTLGTGNMQTVKHAIAIVMSCKNNKNKKKMTKARKKDTQILKDENNENSNLKV